MSSEFNKLRERSGLCKKGIVMLTNLNSELVGQIRRGQRQAPKDTTDKLRKFIKHIGV